MPYHPFVHDNDQGRLTVASRHEQQSQYGLGISTDFHVTGISTFEGAVSLEGGISGHVNIPDGIKDTTGDIGDSGQLLSSTGSGLNWIDANTTNVNSATKAGINLNTDDSDQWLVFAGANSGNNALRVNNTIRVNPSTGRIGIGTEDPLDQLHIHQVGDNAPKLRMVGVSSNPELNFISPSTGAAVIKFSDDNDAAGSITYDHPHNKMKFMIGTTLSFWVSPNAHLRLFEALEDGTGQAGVAGSVFTSTGTKTAWIPQSSIAAGTATTATNAQGIIGNPSITVTDITIGGKLKDGDSNFGSSGQVLSSDGTNTQWINVGSISAGSASSIAVNTNGDNSSQFVTFSEGDSGSQQLRADAGLKYNPNDNELTAGSFNGSVAASNVNSGTLDADRIPNLSGAKITSGTVAAARIDNLSGSKITSGTVAAARIDNLSGAKITSGTVAAARIDNLDANKITSGTLATARIPDLDASKITSGTLSSSRIPNLSASKINDGTLGADRIPNLSGSKITSGTVAAARIDNLSGGKITSGTVAVARLGSGSPSSSTFLRGDGSWQPVDVFVTGMILLWSGAANAVPTGWSLCDGQNNTPDLRNRFVVGASSGTGDTTYPGLSVNATGGSADATLVSHSHSFSANTNNNTHNHGINDPGHIHNVAYSNSDSGDGVIEESGQGFNGFEPTESATTGISIQNNTHNHSVSGTTGTQGSSASNANLPPYYALCYIMKD
jgi:hypothetical protein